MGARTLLFVLHREQSVSLRELCRLGRLSPAFAAELIDEGIIEPSNPEDDPLRWRFPMAAAERARIAVQLAQDLGVNTPGAALAVDLLERLRAMEARMRSLERQLFAGE